MKFTIMTSTGGSVEPPENGGPGTPAQLKKASMGPSSAAASSIAALSREIDVQLSRDGDLRAPDVDGCDFCPEFDQKARCRLADAREGPRHHRSCAFVLKRINHRRERRTGREVRYS